MDYLLFTYQSHPLINIGDYIQSLAAKRFFPNSPALVERDLLNEYDGPAAKVIMNGWFTHRPENFPPSPAIIPLFVAFHLNATCKERFLSPETVAYLKQHAPIGCRDEETVRILKEKGIDAYFSGCLTLTLGYAKTEKPERGEDVYIVDPMSYLPDDNSVVQVLLSLFYLCWFIRPLCGIFKKLKKENPIHFSFSKIGIGRFLLWARAYVFLRRYVDKDVLRDAHYVTHIYGNDELPSDEARFRRAGDLLRMYSRAKLVITSRIHCALPCLGLETPVVFVKSMDDTDKSLCRFKGLEDFFNLVGISKDRIVEATPPNINKNITLRNKDSYKPYRCSLIKRVRSFIEENERQDDNPCDN